MTKRDKNGSVAEANETPDPQNEHVEGEPAEAREDDADGDVTPPSGEETLESLRAERDALQGLLQRARADYQNQKRRALADQEAGLRRNLQPLLESLLLVLDHMDMALSSPTTQEETKNLAMGVSMTRDQLVRSLEEHGVTQVATGGAFDPAVHQAVSTVEDATLEPGTIVETLRPGFLWRDSVLRFAQVRVSAAPQEGEVQDETEA